MESVVNIQISRIKAAWLALTGQRLFSWTGNSNGDVPPDLVSSAVGISGGRGEIQHQNLPWLIGCLHTEGEMTYLASLNPGEPFQEFFYLLIAFLDQIQAEQSTHRDLLDELASARNRLNFLSEVAQIAVETGDLPSMFIQLAKSLLQVIAAQDIFLLLIEEGQTRLFSASGENPVGLEQLSVFASHSHPILLMPGDYKLPRKLLQHRPEIENLALMPLTIASPAMGLLGVINLTKFDLQPADRQLLLNNVEQISMLVNSTMVRSAQEAKHRLDHELTIASQIQTNFLPTTLPDIPGLEFSASLKPASLIGGDFYDVQPVEGGLAIMLGDVAGKGIPAAMLTALIHATLKSESQHHTHPADLLSSINRLIYGELDRSDTFITAFLAVVQTNPLRLDYSSAGHTTTLLWRSQQEEVVQFPSTGLPLGITPDIQYTQRQIQFERGDVLLLYSDGITEAENAQGRVFGTQALIDLLMAGYPAALEKQVGMILTALDLHRGDIPLRDDVAMFMARANLDQPKPLEIIPFVYMAEKRSARSLALQLRQSLQSLIFNSNTVRTNYLNEYELAASEIATNIVVHAYKASPYLGRIQGRICLCADRVTMDIIDSGSAFVQPKSPKKKSGNSRKFSIKDPPASGYGLLIANRLLDELRYSRLRDGRNHWRLEKYLPQGTSLSR